MLLMLQEGIKKWKFIVTKLLYEDATFICETWSHNVETQ
jgi:hypothetical protein